METLQSQKLKKARDYSGSAKKLKYGMNVERCFEGEKCQMRMHEQGYSQSDIEEFGRMANEKWTDVVPSYERLTTEALQGRSTLSKRRQRHHKDQGTL